MPLKHVKISPNQRVTSADLTAMGTLARDGLSLALMRFLSPGASQKVVRGGRVKATTPASKDVLIEPLAGWGLFDAATILDAEDTQSVGDNVSGNPRIDLVSVGVAGTDTDNVLRTFWDPAGQQSFDALTDTRNELRVTVVVTQGVPAAVPSVPNAPVGNIPLAQIAVADGFATITDADITAVEASLATPLRTRTWQWGDPGGFGGGADVPIVPFPYETPDLLTLDTPSEQLTVIVAQVFAKVTALGGGAIQFFLYENDGVTSNVIGRADILPGGTLTDPIAVTVVGFLPSGLGARGIRLGIDALAGGTSVNLLQQDSAAQPYINRVLALTL